MNSSGEAARILLREVWPASPEDGTKGDPCMQTLQTDNGHTVAHSVNTPSQGEPLLSQNSPWPVCSYGQAVRLE